MLPSRVAAGCGDLSAKITGKPPVLVTLVLCCSFVFLVAAFRRIALPERAVVMSPSRTGAALGGTGLFQLVRPMDAPGPSLGSGAFAWISKRRAAGSRMVWRPGLRNR